MSLLEGMAENVMSLAQAFDPRPQQPPNLDAELAQSEQAQFLKFGLSAYSPDQLLTKKGFEIFEKMMRDDAIAQAVRGLKTMRLSTGWEFLPPEDIDAEADKIEAQRQADYFTQTFAKIEGGFHADLNDIMGGLDFGWSLTEKVMVRLTEGPWAGLIAYKALKSKRVRDFTLITDDFLNIVEDGVQVFRATTQVTERMPKSKFVIWSYRKRWEDPFGQAVNREVYDLWWIKQVLKRALGVTFERYGTPFAYATFPSHWKKKAQDDLLNMLRNVKFESVAVIPDKVEMVLQESTGRSPQTILNAIKYIDGRIKQLISGQTLTSESGDRGSQSLGTVHMDVLEMYIEELGKDLATVVNEQLVQPMQAWNFQKPELCPTFKFRALFQDNPMSLYKAYREGVQDGVIVPTEDDEKHYRAVIKAPERTEDSVLLPQAAPPAAPAPPPPDPDADAEDKEDEDREDLAEHLDPTERGIQDPVAEEAATFKDKAIMTGVNRRPFTKHEKRVDFAEVKRTFEIEGVADITADLQPVLQDTLARALRQIEREHILEKQKIGAVKDIKMHNMGDIKRILNDGLNRIARRGGQSANAEMRRARRQENMQADEGDFSTFSKARLTQLLAAEAFSATRKITDSMRADIELALFRGMKNGQSFKSVADGLRKTLEPFLGTVADDFAGPRLDTLVRTSTVDTFNFARQQTFLANSDFVVGMEYSAVLDNRVRVNHAAMDGRIYKTTSKVWDEWKPANGFNCRCLLVPVTKLDGWDGREKPLPIRNGKAVRPDKGFGAAD